MQSQAQVVVAEHLERFAFRGGGPRYAWTRSQDAGHIEVAAQLPGWLFMPASA